MDTLLQKELDEYSLAIGIPVHVFYDQEIIYSTISSARLQIYNLPLYLFSNLPQDLPDAWISCTSEKIYMGGLRIKDTGEMLFIGPLFLTDCSVDQANEILLRLGQKKRDAMNFLQQLNMIKHIDVPQLSHHISFLFMILNQAAPAEISHINFHWSLYPGSRHPVINHPENEGNSGESEFLEDHIVQYIRSGKTDELIHFFNEFFNNFNPLGNDFELTKCYIFGANTYISKIARVEGVDLRVTNSICDHYIEQILGASSVKDLDYVFYQFSTHYAEEIRKAKLLHTDSMIVNRIGAYIQSNIYQKISTDTIASSLGYSSPYLCAEFRKATGMTIMQYVTTRKIEEAKYLLRHGEYSATEISEMLHFTSVTYFCRTFKKYTGISPMEWKNSQKYE